MWIGAVLGLRWSEVAGLRVGAIDMLQRKLTVAEAITRDSRGRPVVDTPKSTAGLRTIAMPEALVDLLAEHLAMRGLTAADAERLVFEAPQGGPLRYANWRRRVWLPAAVAAHFEGAGFHDLRRASATALVVGQSEPADGSGPARAQRPQAHPQPVNTQVVEEADRHAAETVGAQLLSRSGRGGAVDRP
jgi:integrase